MEEGKLPYITDPKIRKYCENYSSKLPAHFDQLYKLTQDLGNIKMISGGFLGQFLYLISLALRPKCILEVGSFTGYGALCLARGLQEGGKVYTIEKDPNLKGFYHQVADASETTNIIQLIGDAADIIPTIDETFDLVFIDAAKRQYIRNYEQIMPRLRQGGMILADNVLWKGKVVSNQNDNLGEGLDAFNKHVFEDDRVDNLIIPIDDGLHMIVKK